MTKQELSQLYYLNKEIEKDKRQLEELKTKAYKITPTISAMPKGGGDGDRVARFACEIGDLEDMIDINIRKCYYEQKRLMNYINCIESSELRMIFSLRYISGLSWRQIAFSIGEHDESYPRRKHMSFLKLAENAETKGVR